MTFVFIVLTICMIATVILSNRYTYKHMSGMDKAMDLFTLGIVPAYVGMVLIGILFAISFMGLSDDCELGIQVLRLLTTMGIFINGGFIAYKGFKTKNSLYVYTGACLFMLYGSLLTIALTITSIYLVIKAMEWLCSRIKPTVNHIFKKG